MKELMRGALDELGAVSTSIDESSVANACTLICDANRVVLYGCGREALQLRGFAMRLFHLGYDVAMQGDINTPPIGPEDLFLCSDGPGRLATVQALVGSARTAGAKVLLITAEPDSSVAHLADHVLLIPAQTMARDNVATQSILPMGSAYEGALFILFEIMVIWLRDTLGETVQTMRARHTNLE